MYIYIIENLEVHDGVQVSHQLFQNRPIEPPDILVEDDRWLPLHHDAAPRDQQ